MPPPQVREHERGEASEKPGEWEAFVRFDPRRRPGLGWFVRPLRRSMSASRMLEDGVVQLVLDSFLAAPRVAA